jgi:FKBP-type peptidyl-prolyl cis-trans isomerase FkpA
MTRTTAVPAAMMTTARRTTRPPTKSDAANILSTVTTSSSSSSSGVRYSHRHQKKPQRRRRREVLFPGFLTFLLSSSSSYSKAASSITCKDVKLGGEGKLEAFENDVASVNYALFLSDEDGNEGAKIDSAKFFVFGVGTGEVIRGFDLALLGDGGNCSPMRVGGVREVLIPPELGYGAKEVGGGRIPANSYLKFVVELVQIK